MVEIYKTINHQEKHKNVRLARTPRQHDLPKRSGKNAQ